MGWEDRAYNRDNTGGVPPVQFRFPPFTPLAMTLIGVNLLLFLLKISEGAYGPLLNWGSLQFGGRDGTWWQVWRWVTYQYLHASGGHVFFNMLALYFFVPTLEQRWGWQKTLGFYTLGGLAAGLAYFVLVAVTGRWGSSLIGASGCVFAAMGAVALLYPERQLILLVFPVPIRVAAALFAVLFLLTVVGDRDFSDAAHLGGLAFGFVAPWLAGPFMMRQQSKVQKWSADRGRRMEFDEQQAVDRILEKVARSGMHSLTGGEKRTLAKASENQRKRDAVKPRRH